MATDKDIGKVRSLENAPDTHAFLQNPVGFADGIRKALRHGVANSDEVDGLLKRLGEISKAGEEKGLEVDSKDKGDEETMVEQLTVRLRAGLAGQSFSSLQQFGVFLNGFAKSNDLGLKHTNFEHCVNFSAEAPSIEVDIGGRKYGVSIYGNTITPVVWVKHSQRVLDASPGLRDHWEPVNVLDEAD